MTKEITPLQIANAIRDLLNEKDNLQQENQKLKEKYLGAVADYETTKSENQQLKFQLEYEKENLMFSKDYAKCLEEKRDKYSSVLDEIREYIKEREPRVKIYGQATFNIDDLLQILDKVKE